MQLSNLKTLVAFPAISFLFLSSCTHHPTRHSESTQVSRDAGEVSDGNALRRTETTDRKTASNDLNIISDHIVIRFAPGQYTLSRADRTRLGDLIESGNNNMQVDRVKVAAWSDHAYPGSSQKLSDKDRALAESRALSVDRYLRNEYQISDIESFNMAENSNWLARAFNTQDAELKSLFSKENSGPISNDDFNVIKENGDAGSVIILIKRKP
jgi:hypothetical protein